MKRAVITLAALLVWGAIGSAAKAQTPAQMAKYQAQYAKNYATYQKYMMTHPWLAQQGVAGPGIGNVPSYLGGYPGQSYPGVYAYPTQQLAANPMMALVAPLLGNYAGAQNYGGGYGGYGSGVPISQPYYGANPYASGPQYGDGDEDDQFEGRHWHHHHHHHDFDGDGGGYGPYGSSAYGPYGGRGYGAYGPAPIAQALGHHHFDRDSRLPPRFARQQFLGANPGASGHAWASRPVGFLDGARRWGRHH